MSDTALTLGGVGFNASFFLFSFFPTSKELEALPFFECVSLQSTQVKDLGG